ncbi:MAG: TIM barrel protein [Ruminococcus sp.]|jgi:deoxyribonuclease-4|nr:TIM barrel protein [Ruminococcus sp.]
MVKFGPGGLGESFVQMGYKKPVQTGEYLEKFRLTAYEYECGQGVRISEDSAVEIGKTLKEKGIAVSLHTPYFISLSSTEEEKRLGSISYILSSAKAVKALGGTRIIIHSGSCSKITRQEALTLAVSTMKSARSALIENGLEDIVCCPETMGKINQLGTLEEVIEICKTDETFCPCIDFGHLYARTLGGLRTKEDYAHILDTLTNELGTYHGSNFHAHFSRIEYTQKGGEKKHLTFSDKTFGPDFKPLIELIKERSLTPTIICESAGSQTEDAKTMMEYYKSL